MPDHPVGGWPAPDPPSTPGQPPRPQPTPADKLNEISIDVDQIPGTEVQRKGKYALSANLGASDWYEINDMEKMYAVVIIQSTLPGAQAMILYAWGLIDEAAE